MPSLRMGEKDSNAINVAIKGLFFLKLLKELIGSVNYYTAKNSLRPNVLCKRKQWISEISFYNLILI